MIKKISSTKDWRDSSKFHKIDGECLICESTEKIGLEPETGYRICEKHKDMKIVDYQQNATVQEGGDDNG